MFGQCKLLVVEVLIDHPFHFEGREPGQKKRTRQEDEEENRHNKEATFSGKVFEVLLQKLFLNLWSVFVGLSRLSFRYNEPS